MVRQAVPDDANAVAAAINTAWIDAYADILPDTALHGRSHDADVGMLLAVLSGQIPGAGCLVLERDGSIVGASIFGPPQSGEDLDWCEVYAIYVAGEEVGTGGGRMLSLGTMRAIKTSGAVGILGHVHVENRVVRRQIERAGTTPHGESLTQDWFGTQVEVVEYRLPIPRRT